MKVLNRITSIIVSIAILASLTMFSSLALGLEPQESNYLINQNSSDSFVNRETAGPYLNTIHNTTVQENEYDMIVAIRKMTPEEREKMNLSNGSDKYLSDEVEKEYLYRASLPYDVLKNEYCYSDEAIRILREYNGEPIEEYPALRAVAATLTTTVGILVYGQSRMGVLYNWSWSSMPSFSGTDCVAAAWQGTYTDGLTNNAALDTSMSFVQLRYFSGSTEYPTTLSITSSDSNNLYNNCYKNATFSKTINGLRCWLKSGSMFLYVDLANASGPKFAEVAFHFCYGHQVLSGTPSVSFPAALSISFSAVMSTYGNRNVRLTANGSLI
ncbi:MAG: hypothetical protein HUJ66_06290 [Oscillospiraceae bacterium]|nr:hypothetical protein [Oscillospiraceae bacterium]